MRIAFQSVFYPYRGGIAQFNASLFRALESFSEVKAFNFSLQYPQLFFPGSSQYVSNQDNADPVDSTRILNSINPISYFKTAKAIERYQPDMLLTAYWQPFLAPAQGTVCKQLKAKTINISILNNIIPHEKKWSDHWFNQYFLKQQHGHIVMGKAIQQELLQYTPQAVHALHPHPIYAHFGDKLDKRVARKHLKISEEKKTLLFFGLIREYKGLDVLLEAFSKLDSSYQLIIAGESYEDLKKYQLLIDKCPHKENIYFHNQYIPDHEVPIYFSAADLCVLPYKSATQSGVVAAAFHFDLPVIVTDKGNLKDTIEPYNTGLVVQEAKATLITEAITYYFTGNHAQEMTRQIAAFKLKYTWKHFGGEIINLYQEIKDV